MKYIFVTGGSFSGIGKGILSSSIGAILQSYGYTVTFLKVDPYLNYNAGRLEPSEHGETFVLADGTEADLDLGNYQRFCNLILDASNTLTSGKILFDIITNEKSGSYNGKTLRFCTDFNDYISKRLQFLQEKPVCTIINQRKVFKRPDFIIVELGGTIGDDEAFFLIKGFSRYFGNIDKNDKCFVTLDYMIEIGDIVKTKLLQNTLNNLKSFGITNDIMIYRGNKEMGDVYLGKVSENCGIKKEHIIWSRDCTNQYDIPQALLEQGLYTSIKELLCLEDRKQSFYLDQKFGIFTKIYGKSKKIGIISRYFTNDQPYTSLEDAVVSAGKHFGHDIEIVTINYLKLANNDSDTFDLLKSVNGIIIPGGFGDLNVETKVMVAHYARMNNIPFLGICLGFQIMVIEFARNLLEFSDAYV
ncbi:CTP synthase [Vittaforma corneae ATCC 50505]|uniref:CTP synthase n=1 Tax=Vittaforma corneae (strain ATCC 50505) TaxID=993615 RepID=L2GRB7_VITCO|nr:CTP synthase [Vittaforma corneae ATCC 50505]ELA42872.1 CTP synthase [Vittaforma corneae ATCC 50505]